MPEWLPLVLALLGGGFGVRLLDGVLSRRSNNTDYWHGEVERLKKDLGELRTEMDEYREESLRWRDRYYTERRDHEATRYQFGSGLLALKDKGSITPMDIENLYQNIIVPRERGIIVETSTD